METQSYSQSAVDSIAKEGNDIYEKRYKERFESEHQGKFVAIDIRGGDAYVGDFAEDAIQTARQRAPYGVFHLIRIGHPGVFSISHARSRKQIGYW